MGGAELALSAGGETRRAREGEGRGGGAEGGEEEEGIPNNKVEVIIEKNRSGARGTVELIFQKEYNKFSSISKREA